MDVNNVLIESDRRCSAKDLERILKKVPVRIIGQRHLKLRARVGLGNIVYIAPRSNERSGIQRSIEGIEFLGHCAPIEMYTDTRHHSTYCTFHYKGRRFDVTYN